MSRRSPQPCSGSRVTMPVRWQAGWTAGSKPACRHLASSKLCPVDAAPGIWVTAHQPRHRPRSLCVADIPLHRSGCSVSVCRRRMGAGYRGQSFQASPLAHPARLSQRDRELCSFDTLLREFDLNDPVLAQLATMVRGADRDRHDAGTWKPPACAPSCWAIPLWAGQIMTCCGSGFRFTTRSMPA